MENENNINGAISGNESDTVDNVNVSENTVLPETEPEVTEPVTEPEVQTAAEQIKVDEPTVTFEAVKEPQKESSSTGIKVFFAMLAVVVMLVSAVAVGYIFGISNSEVSNDYNATASFQNKSDATSADNITVYNNVSPSIVCIEVYNSTSMSSASGVVYSSDGYIVTNDHIYSSIASPKFLVRFPDGTEYDAVFVAGDTRSDLAVLKIDAKDLKPATFGNYNEVITGESVVAIGYPSGAGVEPIFTSGSVSSKGIRITGTSSYSVKMIQTDTPINPGNSGGALVNMYSQVIGITSVKMVGSQFDSVGYAIPSSTVVSVIDSLIKNGYVENRGKLGITYTAIDSVNSKLKDIPTGMMIQSVTTDSDFYGKNLNQGDIITHINDIEITRADIALDIIDATSPDETISVTVYHSSNGTSEKIYGKLIPDQGNSSYTTEIARK